MGTLGDDLALLSVWQGGGRIGSPGVTGVGLMGAEVVRLAASGRIDITSGRITVLDPAPTGDAEADAALAGLAAQRRPPRARGWCSRPRRGICDAYLARLAAAGVLRRQEQTRLGFIRATRWQVTDTARVADARARLDAIAEGTGQVDLGQAAFGGLAHAVGLAGRLYPSRDGRDRRKRLELVADGGLTAGPDGPAPHAHHAVSHSVHAASHAAVSAAVHSATHAAVSAAHSAHHAGAGGHGGGHGGH
jgi:Golgi phosphoprotein 3 (GPP34)